LKVHLANGIRFKVSRLYPPNEGSLAGCEPQEAPVRFEPRTQPEVARVDSRLSIAGAPPPARMA